MADEPRRSVRATKGQHTKSLDLLNPVEPRKKVTKKPTRGADKNEDEEVEVIRCVCGARETGDDEGEPWIACDNCGVWQHNICVGISRFTEDAPDKYLCEQCDAQFPLHRELLDGLKKGRKLWEERRSLYEQELADEEKQGTKKKGKKNKSKRPSDQLEPSPAPKSKPKSPTPPMPGGKKEHIARSGSTKRKTRDESHDKESIKEPQSKARKVSARDATPKQTLPPSDPHINIGDLDPARQGTAKLILKNLQPAVQAAVQDGVYTLKIPETIDSKAERLAVHIEDAVYSTHPDKSTYSKQVRTIAFNLKKNQELCNGLLSRTLAPNSLAVMSSDDMATKELKHETAKMKARVEKQSIMITDDNAPRVRRTHKGEEVVEGDNFTVPNDNASSTPRRRVMPSPSQPIVAHSREGSPNDEVELPEYIDSHQAYHHPENRQSLTIDTKPRQDSLRKTSTSADFDISKVFSSVQSPVTAQHGRRPSANIGPPPGGQDIDPEIDKLLRDDEGNESPPYSPAEYDSNPEVVWRGSVTMDSIARFSAVAKHIGGADLSNKIPWDDMLQKELKVAGRIDQEKANEYLCSLRYSPPTDVVIVGLTQAGEAGSQGYQQLFDYFHSKNRYGVLTNKGVGNIRDTYLVPIPPYPGHLPDFIINLEGHRVPETRSEPMIVVALVIRSEWYPDPPRSSDAAQSPSVMGHPQRQISISGAPPSMSPIAPQSGTLPTPPIQQSPLFNAQEGQQRSQTEERRQREGEAVAARILGPHINAPTVAFLMPQSFQMRPLEWEVIRDILEQDPVAQQNLQHLSQVLEARMAAENPRRGLGDGASKQRPPEK